MTYGMMYVYLYPMSALVWLKYSDARRRGKKEWCVEFQFAYTREMLWTKTVRHRCRVGPTTSA